jgi:hypothetical protein
VLDVGCAGEKGLAGDVAFRLQDYRDVTETLDRIVSVGMFEHVGVVFYDRFFRACAGRSPTTASWCCTRSAARRGRASPTRGSPSTYSLAACVRSKAGAACRCGSPANDNAAIRRKAAARVMESSPPHYQSAIVKVDLPTYQEQIRRR